MRAALIAIIALAGCVQERETTEKPVPDVVLDAMYGMIARHPADPTALAAAIEESDYYDTYLDRAVAELVRRGHVSITVNGLVPIPPADWPQQERTK